MDRAVSAFALEHASGSSSYCTFDIEHLKKHLMNKVVSNHLHFLLILLFIVILQKFSTTLTSCGTCLTLYRHQIHSVTVTVVKPADSIASFQDRMLSPVSNTPSNTSHNCSRTRNSSPHSRMSFTTWNDSLMKVCGVFLREDAIQIGKANLYDVENMWSNHIWTGIARPTQFELRFIRITPL